MNREWILEILSHCKNGCSGCTFEDEAYCQEMLRDEIERYLTEEKHFRFEDEEGAEKGAKEMEEKGLTAEEKLRSFVMLMALLEKDDIKMPYTTRFMTCIDFLSKEYPQMKLAHARDMVVAELKKYEG